MDKKQYLQNTFNEVAQGYDHPALSFFPQTAKLMVERMTTSENTNFLDVCTGTGVVALEAASHITGGQVTAIDLSQGMLDQAQSKAKQAGLQNIDFMQMDLDALNFPDQKFDCAACSFGLFFLDDMEQGLRNIIAKVRQGGQAAISTFSEGAFEPMSGLFLSRYEKYGYDVPPLSWKKITTDQQLTELFGQAGITTLDIHREPLGFKMSSAQDWWDIVWNAGFRGLLSQMKPDELEHFKIKHLAEVQQLCDQGQDWMNSAVVIAIGTK